MHNSLYQFSTAKIYLTQSHLRKASHANILVFVCVIFSADKATYSALLVWKLSAKRGD